MEALRTQDIVTATGGRLVKGDPEAIFPNLSTDTRRLAPRALYLALRGLRFDGHDFVTAAVEAGAGGVVIARDRLDLADELPPTMTVVAVDDTLVALGRIANHRRRAHATPLVAITGSNGKTSTKELIAAMLSGVGEVLKTPGNHNNLVGLPLTLLELSARHDFVVLEMGTSEPGEIERLAAIAEPDVGVVLNVSAAHTEGLADLDGVAREKGALYRALGQAQVAVVNADDPRVVDAARKGVARTLTFGAAEAADFRVTARHFVGEGPYAGGVVTCPEGAVEVRTNVIGFHQVHNAAAALAAVRALGVDPRQVAGGLARVETPPHRMHFEELAGLRVLDDCYNANPASTLLALRTLVRCRDQSGGQVRAIAVLGDMKELGSLSERAHRTLGRQAAEVGIDVLIAVGPEAKTSAEAAQAGVLGEVVHVAGAAQAARALRAAARPGDWVLIKGSRSMALEKVVEALKNADHG